MNKTLNFNYSFSFTFSFTFFNRGRVNLLCC